MLLSHQNATDWVQITIRDVVMNHVVADVRVTHSQNDQTQIYLHHLNDLVKKEKLFLVWMSDYNKIHT